MTKTSPRSKFLWTWFSGIFYFMMAVIFFSSIWTYDMLVYKYVVEISPMTAYMFLGGVVTFIGFICATYSFIMMEQNFDKSTEMLDNPDNVKSKTNDNTKNPYRLC